MCHWHEVNQNKHFREDYSLIINVDDLSPSAGGKLNNGASLASAVFTAIFVMEKKDNGKKRPLLLLMAKLNKESK